MGVLRDFAKIEIEGLGGLEREVGRGLEEGLLEELLGGGVVGVVEVAGGDLEET